MVLRLRGKHVKHHVVPFWDRASESPQARALNAGCSQDARQALHLSSQPAPMHQAWLGRSRFCTFVCLELGWALETMSRAGLHGQTSIGEQAIYTCIIYVFMSLFICMCVYVYINIHTDSHTFFGPPFRGKGDPNPALHPHRIEDSERATSAGRSAK